MSVRVFFFLPWKDDLASTARTLGVSRSSDQRNRRRSIRCLARANAGYVC
jgi:hypothetical protein